MVGARPARARADEARPPAAPVPRQVHPAARRDPARALRAPGGRVLDPFAGSGTTLVQALECGLRRGRRRTSPRSTACSCGVKTGCVQPVRARARAARRARARRASAGRAVRVRARLVRAAGRRGAARVPLARSATTSTPTCCGSSSRAPPARPGGRPTSTSTSRARRSSSRTGATSTGASAGRSSAPAHFLAALRRSTRCADPGVRARPERGCEATVAARRRARARLRRPVRRGRHLAAVSRADRLPRAAPLRVRAARPRRPARARARRRRARHGAGRDRARTRRGSPPCSRTPARRCGRARRC